MAGDALGSLVEFQSAERIQKRYPNGVREMADGGTFDKIAGQVTDDCEMAISLGRSILKAGTYHNGEAAVAYAHWRASNPFDIGNTTRASLDPALRALSDGRSPEVVASRASGFALPESQANGALMRVTPLAIWGAGTDLTDDELASAARADASLTHIHPVCQDANAVYVIAMRYALTAPRGPREVYDYALQWARDAEVEPSVLERLELAEREGPDSGKGWVLNAFQAAFHALLHFSYDEGVSWAISIGADTDTNAAITGGLLGAVHGIDDIPAEWTRAVITSRPHFDLGRGRCVRPKWLWSCDALLLAEALLDLSSQR
jgi:ADP-ribosylglycohydrolase